MVTGFALFGELGTGGHSMVDFEPGPRLFVAAIGGAFAISLMAKAAPIIRGHGIPEAMEAVLTKQSRVAPRTAILKPLSAALAIGTGAPFGAEGPIIVTGGSIGSLLGQVIPVTPSERKILDRKSTRLNSSHVRISYAVFCLKKKTQTTDQAMLPLIHSSPSGLPVQPIISRSGPSTNWKRPRHPIYQEPLPPPPALVQSGSPV